jgi:hypothetical protein
MLVTTNTLALAITLGSTPTPSTPTTGGFAQTLAMSGDSGRVARVDTSARTGVPSRSIARAGIDLSSNSPDFSQESSDSLTTQRRRAVEHSDWYYRRLTIHKAASYATLPLFVTEYYLGDKLFRNKGTSSTKSAHSAVAAGIGVLFGVNTVTGVWNLWDSRHDTEGRARRMTHSILMLASDAGFAATAATAPGGNDGGFNGNSNDRRRHRAIAVGSMGVATASYLMMYFWK